MAPAARKELINSLTKTEIELLLMEWPLWARPEQLAPGLPWRVWLLMAGRGFGKTRAGAEWVRMQARNRDAPSNGAACGRALKTSRILR